MLRTFSRLRVSVFALPLFIAATAFAQAPSPNADILKMVQAGLPETLVISKIHEGAGNWDTSADALIALKNAGATDAELSAFVTPAAPAAGSQVYPSAAGSMQPVEAFGGQIFRTRSGDPYLQFQSNKPFVFPDGRPSNSAWLVTFQGEVAVMVPSSLLFPGDFTDCNPSNVLFLQSKIIVDSYVEGGCGSITTTSLRGRYQPKPAGFVELSRQGLRVEKGKELGMMQRVSVGNSKFGLSFDTLITEGGKKGVKNNFLFGIFPLNFTKLGPDTAMRSPMLEAFVDQLLSNFDATVSEFEKVAGIADPATQLPADAHYERTTTAQSERYWAVMDQAYKEAEQNKTSNGFGSLLSAMQGVQNMASAQSAANVAAANHDMAGQFNAAMAAGTAEMQTLNAVSNPNAPTIQPLAAPAPNAFQGGPGAIQTTTNAQLTAIQAKQAQIQAQQAAQQKPVITASAAPPKTSVHAKAPSSGTAAPPTCVDLGPGNCMPIAQYQQMQGQKNQQSADTEICPPSGFISGTGHYAACDAFVGERVGCTPGHAVPIPPPAVPPASCGPVASNTSSSGGSSSGSGSTSGKDGSSATGGSIQATAPGTGCNDISLMVNVESRWAKPNDPSDHEVIVFVTNNYLGPITCTMAYHKHGQWTDIGQGTYPQGATHVGGEMHGSFSYDDDSSTVKYACFAGLSPMDNKGNFCTGNVTFSGPTIAGTDR